MLMVLGAVYTLYRVQTHSTKVEASRLEAQEYANAVLDLMVREIRNAGACSGGIISAAKQKAIPTKISLSLLTRPAAPPDTATSRG
jgi:Tfp pilus assembly protein PilW